jgi:prepilin-type N-terminal cleavage/methylation domain-containing protein
MRAAAARGARGFTLVELAVVLAIVGLLLGSLMYTLSAQMGQRNFEETRRRLDMARELILTYAIVKGRLPCPARFTSTASHSNGQESFCTAAAGGHTTTCAGSETTTEPVPNHGTCSNHFDGFLPAATIGYLQTDAEGFALDAWGNRIRYGVARSIASGTCSGTSMPPNLYTTMFTSRVLLRTHGITCQPANMIVCKSGTGITETIPTSCGGAANQIMTQDLLVAVVLSTGKNGATGGGTGTDEAANLNTGPVFVWHTPTATGVVNEFDDQMTWITVGEFYGRLISAGALP